MKELLQKLLKEDILDEATIEQIKESFEQQKEEAIAKAVEEAEEKVRLELSENFVEEKKKLIEALDAKTEEAIAKEVTELKEDIDRFRDLEAEYATKLVEAKEELGVSYKKELTQLVEMVDSFLEVRLDEEFEELKEDIEEVKKLQFGKKIFEAVAEEFKHLHSNESGLEAELNESREELENLKKQLDENNKSLAKQERDKKLTAVLEPLHGRPREIMEAILSSVATEKLEEAYEKFIPKVLTESATDEETTEKEDKVLAESNTEVEDAQQANEKLVDGNSGEEIVEEQVQREGSVDEVFIHRMQRMAGVKDEF